MPNCDYFATLDDNRKILDYLFEGDECHIYELYSDFGTELRRFSSADQVLAEFDRVHNNGSKWWSVELQLYLPAAGPPFKSTKVELNPEKCDGYTFRYSAQGFGLIQLYLCSIKDSMLENSHTNHNTLKRALKWARTDAEMREIEALDFDLITKFSSKINRTIRKLSVAKLGSCPVLPGALDLWEAGTHLGVYSPDDETIELK